MEVCMQRLDFWLRIFLLLTGKISTGPSVAEYWTQQIVLLFAKKRDVYLQTMSMELNIYTEISLVH